MGRFSNARHLRSSQAATAGSWEYTIPINRILQEIGQIWVKPGTATAFTIEIWDSDGAKLYDSGEKTEEHLEHLSIFTYNGPHTIKLTSVAPAEGTFDSIRLVYR